MNEISKRYDDLKIFETYLGANGDLTLTAIELSCEPEDIRPVIKRVESTTVGNILKTFYVQFARNFARSANINERLGEAFERVLDREEPDAEYIKLAMDYIKTNAEAYKDINSIHNLLHSIEVDKNFFNIPKELPDGTVDIEKPEV